MNALLELLAWLADGDALLGPQDAARFHDALALKLDWCRHVDRDIAVKDSALAFVADELEAHANGASWGNYAEEMNALAARLRKAIDGAEL